MPSIIKAVDLKVDAKRPMAQPAVVVLPRTTQQHSGVVILRRPIPTPFSSIACLDQSTLDWIEGLVPAKHQPTAPDETVPS